MGVVPESTVVGQAISVDRASQSRIWRRNAAPDLSGQQLVGAGAGRAPLVRASLKAAERAGRLLKVYAVEKNPNAVATIKQVVLAEGWQDKVTPTGALPAWYYVVFRGISCYIMVCHGTLW